MSREPLVSIVTPCYNGAAYVDRFFETVMDQTWPHIELIFVDDGSTDDTLAKAEAWRKRLEARGITFKLLTHPNGGQASAINVGLPHVTGKYVMWPDSDDLMDPKNVELKARYLEGHPEKGLVVCDVACVDEDDLGSVVRSSVFDDSRYRLFDALIREEKGAFCSGIAYLARADASSMPSAVRVSTRAGLVRTGSSSSRFPTTMTAGSFMSCSPPMSSVAKAIPTATFRLKTRCAAPTSSRISSSTFCPRWVWRSATSRSTWAMRGSNTCQ